MDIVLFRAAVIIQSAFRCHQNRCLYVLSREHIIQIQSLYRGWTARKQFHQSIQSTIAIQKVWRGFSAKLQYHFDLSDVIFVQALVRKKVALKIANHRRNAMETVQCAARRWLAVRELHRLQQQLFESQSLLSAVILCQVRKNCHFKPFSL